MSLSILILGINGFIGHRLTEHILSKTDWKINGLDLARNRIERCLRYPRLHFHQGDLYREKAWLQENLKISDVIIPLIDISSPTHSTQDLLQSFELQFETNLEIIQRCFKYKKRLVIPSHIDRYGLSQVDIFDEDASFLTLGPIQKEEWLQASSKQMLDRLIYAYGQRNNLNFTLFRPFNWFGPKQDNIFEEQTKNFSLIPDLIWKIVHAKDIELPENGEDKRCFTYIDDGIDALMNIIENENNNAGGKIFNLGNPRNIISLHDLAEKIKDMIKQYPKYQSVADKTKIIYTTRKKYEKPFKDLSQCIPSIKNAEKYLKWEPKTDINIGLKNILDDYLL
jgi:nucleoside-diphosphate-sugar epimerase